jgi:hypothetical protein
MCGKILDSDGKKLGVLRHWATDLQETGGFFCVFVTALTHFGGVE